MNSDNDQSPTADQSLSKEDVSKATSELNNLLQIIAGSSTEIANLRQGNDGSEPYVSMLRASIERAEAVASDLTQKAGGTHQKSLMHPDLAVFAKPKKIAEMPIHKPQILAVDDEEVALMLVKQLLTTAGYQVTTAQSGFECLDLFRRRPFSYQLVLLDLTMPFMDGEETFSRLKDIRANIPVLLCTGFIQRERLDRLMSSGLAGFLRKPIAPDEIVALVRRTLAELRYAREVTPQGFPAAM